MSALDTTAPAVAVSASGELTKLADATRETIEAKPLPKAVADAWRHLPAVNGTVRIPSPGAQWSEQELANAADALETARTLRRAAEAIEKAVTEGYLTECDLRARTQAAMDPDFDAKLAGALRNGAGHYILGESGRPTQTRIPGTDKVLSAEYTIGKPQMTPEALAELKDTGAITGREYRRLTRTVRVIDPEAVARETSRNPSLRARLRGAWKRPAPSIRVHVRNAKAAPTAAA